jgi:hypothetical protein
MKKNVLKYCISVTTITLLIGCDFGNGISALTPEKVLVNPRAYEGKEIAIVGVLSDVDDQFKLFSINAKVGGPSTDSTIFLKNQLAKIDMGTKVIIKGEFQTFSMPMVGAYFMVDAKSVSPCTTLSFCQ